MSCKWPVNVMGTSAYKTTEHFLELGNLEGVISKVKEKHQWQWTLGNEKGAKNHTFCTSRFTWCFLFQMKSNNGSSISFHTTMTGQWTCVWLVRTCWLVFSFVLPVTTADNLCVCGMGWGGGGGGTNLLADGVRLVMLDTWRCSTRYTFLLCGRLEFEPVCCCNINCAQVKRRLHSRWNFISTFTGLHGHGDDRWPTIKALCAVFASAPLIK